MNHSELITTFYQNFSDRNIEEMVACYHDDIVFEDPAFGVLKGAAAKDMWRMLLSREGSDFTLVFSDVVADEKSGSASWKATYSYGPQKRKVINNITAQFEFKDGKIIKHTDTFDLWKWSKQALGVSGYLLGWSGFMKNGIQKKTNQLLSKFQKK